MHLSFNNLNVVLPKRLELRYNRVFAAFAVQLHKGCSASKARGATSPDLLEKPDVNQSGLNRHHSDRVGLGIFAQAVLVRMREFVPPRTRPGRVFRAVSDSDDFVSVTHAGVQHNDPVLKKTVHPHVPLVEQIIFFSGLKSEDTAVPARRLRRHLKSGRPNMTPDVERDVAVMQRVARRIIFVKFELVDDEAVYTAI
jgi:hypothetical protein